MTRYGMVIDADSCTGCFNCFLACRDEHSGNDHRPVFECIDCLQIFT